MIFYWWLVELLQWLDPGEGMGFFHVHVFLVGATLSTEGKKQPVLKEEKKALTVKESPSKILCYLIFSSATTQ